MSEPTNKDRALWAAHAARKFAELTRHGAEYQGAVNAILSHSDFYPDRKPVDPDILVEVVGDLIVDLAHLLRRAEIPFTTIERLTADWVDNAREEEEDELRGAAPSLGR